MIEGHYILYGCRGPLYFGVAIQQTFGVRFVQHQGWLAHIQGLQIRLGRPEVEGCRPNQARWQTIVAAVEAYTIYYHSFPCNNKNIGGYQGRHRLWVQNLGEPGNLQLEYTTEWETLPLPPPPDTDEEPA
jgi:hypothetical protein